MDKYLYFIVLNCLHKMNSERTIYATFHLLNGKKSSQTIQDAHLYQLTNLFQTYPMSDRSQFNYIIAELTKKGLIQLIDENRYIPTERGDNELSTGYKAYPPLPYLNGWRYQDTVLKFWQRLTFFIQIVSHLIRGERSYYPIEHDPLAKKWMKSFFKKQQIPREQLGYACYDELNKIFSNNPPEDPRFITFRLTGSGQIGKTVDQAAALLHIETTEYWYRYLHLLHYIIWIITTNPHEYSFLYSFIADVHTDIKMTKSTSVTYKLLKKGFSIEDIAAYRKVKKSTIEDHIIEIVLNDPQFPIDDFIHKDTLKKIKKTAAIVGKKKLRPIKERLENVTYFQIRLALAVLGDE